MFELSQQQCKLSSFNPRAELHGEDVKAAGDLKLEVNLSADSLAEFHPSLRGFLFHKDAAQRNDLGDQGTDLPNLRFPLMAPFKWGAELVGYTLEIEHGLGGKSNLVLEGCEVNNFTIAPMEGGTVVLTFRVQGHPDEKACGKLCMLVGEKIDCSLTPPPAEDAGEPDADAATPRTRRSRKASLDKPLNTVQ